MKKRLIEALARTAVLKSENKDRIEKIKSAKKEMHDAACTGAGYFRERAESGHEGAQVAYMNLQRAKKRLGRCCHFFDTVIYLTV